MINRLVYIAPIAIAVSAAFIGAAAAPAMAATGNVCATAPAQLRAAAATADATAQRKALYYVKSGEQLCAANADFAAKQDFARAAKLLNTDLAAAPAATTGVTASAQ